MSGLWNFSVRVQSWSEKIESDQAINRTIFENHQSDPVLIRWCKTMYFHFASWSKITTGAILPSAKHDCWRQNSSCSAFTSWVKIDTRDGVSTLAVALETRLKTHFCQSWSRRFESRRLQVPGLWIWQRNGIVKFSFYNFCLL